jgi:twinkle protein
MTWVPDQNVVAFRSARPISEDATFIGEAKKHVGAAGHILSTPAAGDFLPWGKTRKNVRLRKNEFSIWTGTNFAGKSLMLGEISLGLIRQNRKVAMISLEMPPERTLARMLRQAAMARETTKEFEQVFQDWIDGRFFIYERTTSLTTKRTLDIIDYCAQELGANHIIVDSLMKCNGGASSFDAQKKFIEDLFNRSKHNTDMHLHLVAHFGKPKPGQAADRYSIKGPTEIGNVADNVFIMARNMKKKREMEKAEADRDENIMLQSDGWLQVDKQRNGEWDGPIRLWYEKESMQYVADDSGRSIDFLADNEADEEREAIQQEGV